MLIQPYLFFGGRCAEAIEFYTASIDAEVQMSMRFSDSPEAAPEGTLPDGWDDKIMHAALSVGDALMMMSDGNECPAAGEPGFLGFSLSLTAPDRATADRWFDALSEGGTVRMPMGSTFWSDHFGMVQDRFGVGWMVTVPMEEPTSA